MDGMFHSRVNNAKEIYSSSHPFETRRLNEWSWLSLTYGVCSIIVQCQFSLPPLPRITNVSASSFIWQLFSIETVDQ